MTALAPEDLHVLSDFAAHLGLPSRPARDGSFSFAFSDAGVLTIEASADGQELMVSLARRPARMDASTMRAALARGGFDPAAGRLVQVALAGDGSLIQSVRLRSGELSLPVIDDCLGLLRQKHEAVA